MERIGPDVLALDCNVEIERIAERLRSLIVTDLRRRGAVIAVSGGVDSSVCAALACRALGPERVFALLLPESESSAGSHTLGLEVVHQLGMPYAVENIGPALKGPLVLAFSKDDPGAAARVLKAFAKDHEKLVATAVSLGGQLLPGKDLDRVAALPTRAQALSQLMGVMRAPIQKLVGTLAATPSKLVRTLEAVRVSKAALAGA